MVTKAKIYKNRFRIPYGRNYNRQRTTLHAFKMIEETMRDLKEHRKNYTFLEQLETYMREYIQNL